MKRQGFTLMELLIVVAIISVVAASAWTSLPGFRSIDYLRDSGQNTLLVIRKAQGRASAGYLGQAWGVKVLSDKVILFSGASYASRNPDNDQEFSLEKGVLADSQEVVFDKGNGFTSQSQIVLRADNNILRISVNRLGLAFLLPES